MNNRRIFSLNGFRNALSTKRNFLNTIQAATDPNTILVRWPTGAAGKNFGDKLNPYLVERISGRRVINRRDLWNAFNRPQYSVIGSALGRGSDRNCTIWGTGFISYSKSVKHKPRAIRAVRGPLTRKKLLEANIDCPEVYGDPALLLPRYLNVQTGKQYRAGFIPQHRDVDLNIVRAVEANLDIRVIDITMPIVDFVEELCACDCVITSSLHALIAADAYQVPSTWVRLSENPKGDWFKFTDYYESIGYKNVEPEKAESPNDIDKLVRACQKHELNIDLDKLYESCPFKPS